MVKEYCWLQCFPVVSGQPVSRARSTRQTIDWLHWSQLLEVSAEATTLTHTHPHTDRQDCSDLIPDIMTTSLCQPLAARFLFSLAQFRSLSSASVHQQQELRGELFTTVCLSCSVHLEKRGYTRTHLDYDHSFLIYQFKLFKNSTTEHTGRNVSVSKTSKIWFWIYL